MHLSTKKSREQREQERWYISRAHLQLQEAVNYSQISKYAESVNSAYESIEFSLKALCKLLDVEYNPEHFVDKYTLVKLSEKIGEQWLEKKEILLGVIPIALSYSDTLRNIAKYGIENREKKVRPVSPDRIFRQEYSDKVLEDARRLDDILTRIELSFRWDTSRPIKLAILNGYAQDPSTEKACSEYVWTLQQGIPFWRDYFSKIKRNEQPKYEVQEINAGEISEEFAVVLNPFGETYPERSMNDRYIYNQIKLFIKNGGVFVNTAGFPFFYAWDTKKGEKKLISEERLFLPKTFDIREGTITIKELQEVFSFTGTLFYKDFGAWTTYDTKTHSGPHEVETFQTEESKKLFGDLGISKVHEFRALRKETRDCLPVLTANCYEFGEIYPIGAIRFGRGFIVVGGMTMDTEEQAMLFAKAIDHFCEWMVSVHSRAH